MSIIKHVTLQKIVAHDFRYDPRNLFFTVRVTDELHNTPPPTKKEKTGNVYCTSVTIISTEQYQVKINTVTQTQNPQLFIIPFNA